MTPEEKAAQYAAALCSVSVIDNLISGALASDDVRGRLSQNAEHLGIVLAVGGWSVVEEAALQAAIDKAEAEMAK